MSADCIFCKIAKGEIPADKIYDDEEIVAFRDINPQAPTHVIVIPKKHYASLNDIPPENIGFIAKIYNVIQKIVRQEKIADEGYRTIVNTNRMAGQEVFHIHFHILGGRPLGKMG